MSNRDQLILNNMEWARGLARQLHAPDWLHDDLEGAALLGLCQAADRWDPRRGVPFQPYAQRRIRGAVKDECRQLAQHAKQPTRRAHDAPVVDVVINATSLKINLDRFRASDQGVCEMEIQDDINKLLQRVTGSLRRVLSMRADGLIGREIAAVLGVSEGYVSELYHKVA